MRREAKKKERTRVNETATIESRVTTETGDGMLSDCDSRKMIFFAFFFRVKWEKSQIHWRRNVEWKLDAFEVPRVTVKSTFSFAPLSEIASRLLASLRYFSTEPPNMSQHNFHYSLDNRSATFFSALLTTRAANVHTHVISFRFPRRVEKGEKWKGEGG